MTSAGAPDLSVGAALDLPWIRARFPTLSDPDHVDWVHAQNAGGSYRCRHVLESLDHFHRATPIQGGSHFPAGAAQARATAAAGPALARWLGVNDDEVHVGPSTSALTSALGHAFAGVLGPGDAVVVTDQDHEANSGAWRRLADVGVDLREWRVDPVTGRLALADLDALLDDDVAVVAFPHVSNLVGEVTPVAEVAARAHAVGAVAIADGVAAAPHGLPDVDGLGVDGWLFSAYKTYGPHQGVLVLRRAVADRLPNQGHAFLAGEVTRKFVPAGPDHAQVAALAAMVDYFDDLVHHHGGDRGALAAAVVEHERRLVEPILDVVADRSGVRVLGPSDPDARVPLVSVATERPASEVAAELADHHVMAAGSHFYAWRLVRALGIDPAHGVVRVSLVHYNTVAEAERVAAALDAVLPG